jgi:hypothetical protein
MRRSEGSVLRPRMIGNHIIGWVGLPLIIALSLDVGAQPDRTDKSPHKSGFVTVNNVKLHYMDWGGAGETLLFLHGMGHGAFL